MNSGTAESTNISVEPADTFLIKYAVGRIPGSNSTLSLPIPILLTTTSAVCFLQVTGLWSVLSVVIPASMYVFVVTLSEVVIPVTVLVPVGIHHLNQCQDIC